MRNQYSTLPATPGSHEYTIQQPAEPKGIYEYLEVLRRQKFIIIGCMLACGLASALMTIPTKPIYQAKATLEIKGVNENVLNLKDFDSSAPASMFSQDVLLQTQIELLRSKTLVARAVRAVQLNRAFEQPKQPSWRDTVEQWKQRLRLAPVPRPATSTQLAVQEALANLKVHGSGQTRIVEIVYESSDPQLAADFVNALTKEYIEQELESRWKSSQTTNAWLAGQLDDLRLKLEKSQEQLLAYASQNGLVYTQDKNSVADEKLRQLQAEVSRAQAERMTKQARYESALNSPPESLPQILDNPLLRDQYAKMIELRREYADLTSLLTPSHYKVKRVEAQLAELNGTIKKETSNILNRTRSEFESAQRQEKLLTDAYGKQAALVLNQANKSVRYSVLKGEADSNRQLYEAMLQKVKEAGIATAVRASTARVVDPAEPPILPVKPNVPFNTSIGLASGLIFGLMFAFLRQGSDQRLYRPGDVSEFLNVKELGVIPIAEQTARKRLRSSWIPPGREAGADGSLSLIGPPPLNTEASVLQEGVRATATSILFAAEGGGDSRLLVCTSANAGDGKTTTISQLGVSLARTNRKVLLIDGDIRKPQLHDLFAVNGQPGLTDILSDTRPVEECPIETMVQRTTVPGLYVLSSGSHSNPNLLYSARLVPLLLRLRARFDHVLIDTSPILQVSDARVWARHADAVILVLRAGSTTRDTASTVMRQLAEDGTPLLGTVLNYWNPSDSPYKDKYYGTYSATNT